MPWQDRNNPAAGFWTRTNIMPALDWARENGYDVQFDVRVRARRGRRAVRYEVLQYRDGTREIVPSRGGAVFVPFYSHGINPDTFIDDLWDASGYENIRNYFAMRLYEHERLDPESLGSIDYIAVRFVTNRSHQ